MPCSIICGPASRNMVYWGIWLYVRSETIATKCFPGNHRLRVLKEMGVSPVPCVIVEMNDADAGLLAQALNHVHGEENLGFRAATIRKVLESISPEEVLSVLPETAIGLKSLASLGKQSPEEYLTHWQQAQPARLKHLQFQLTSFSA